MKGFLLFFSLISAVSIKIEPQRFQFSTFGAIRSIDDIQFSKEADADVLNPVSRRRIAAAVILGGSVTSASAAPPPASLGGGIALVGTQESLIRDTIFPASILGEWICKRTLTEVQGDVGQAELMWQILNAKRPNDDGFQKQRVDTYRTRFIQPPIEYAERSRYTFQDEMLEGVVLDRGFELTSRGAIDVSWDVRTPGKIKYGYIEARKGGNSNMVQLEVVQRSSSLPSEEGFGMSNELIRILTPGSFSIKTERACRVQRRYRRGFSEGGDEDKKNTGSRIIEGIELVKTYRVLDGIAGIEYPTSMAKYVLRLERP